MHFVLPRYPPAAECLRFPFRLHPLRFVLPSSSSPSPLKKTKTCVLPVKNAAAADLLLLRESYHPAADYIARAASSGAHSPKHDRSSPITPTPCRRPTGRAARVLQQPVSTRPAPPLSAPHSATSRSPYPRLFYLIYSYGTQHFAAYAEAVAEGQPSYDALSSAAKVRPQCSPKNTSRPVLRSVLL